MHSTRVLARTLVSHHLNLLPTSGYYLITLSFRLRCCCTLCFECIGYSFWFWDFTLLAVNSLLTNLRMKYLLRARFARTIRLLEVSLWISITFFIRCLFLRINNLLWLILRGLLLMLSLHMTLDIIWTPNILAGLDWALDYRVLSMIALSIKCWLRQGFLLHWWEMLWGLILDKMIFQCGMLN